MAIGATAKDRRIVPINAPNPSSISEAAFNISAALQPANYREQATKLGDRFAFVVLNSAKICGKPFAVHLPLHELEQRTRSQRI
jgi:hypothetical protein